MTQSMFKGIGPLALVAIFVFVAIGCSDFNPTGNEDATAIAIDNSGISGGLGDFGNKDVVQETPYPFVFTGHVTEVNAEKQVIFFEGKNFAAIIEDGAIMVQKPDGFRAKFNFRVIEPKMELTIYGKIESDEAVTIKVVEYFKNERSTRNDFGS